MAALFVLVFGCLAPAASGATPAFEEAAAELGIDFLHFNGMTGQLYTAEVVGPGVALFDFDNDGDLDIYLGQGREFEGDEGRAPVFPRQAGKPAGRPPLPQRTEGRRRSGAPVRRRDRGAGPRRPGLQHRRRVRRLRPRRLRRPLRDQPGSESTAPQQPRRRFRRRHGACRRRRPALQRPGDLLRLRRRRLARPLRGQLPPLPPGKPEAVLPDRRSAGLLRAAQPAGGGATACCATSATAHSSM